MQAEKILLETDASGRLIGVPQLPENRRIEAIFLILDEKPSSQIKRKPHPGLANQLKITGNIFNSAPTDDWDLAK